MERIVIDLFKAWVRGKVTYTNRTKNANKMLKVLPKFCPSSKGLSVLMPSFLKSTGMSIVAVHQANLRLFMHSFVTVFFSKSKRSPSYVTIS